MKKSTIKQTNRAYDRLYKYVCKLNNFETFLETFNVEIIPYGQERHGDCGVRVTDSAGKDADLGFDIPNKITYSNFIEPNIQTWIEYYRDGNKTKKLINGKE